MTGLLRHARHEMVKLDQNKAHVFAANHALVHYASGAVYSFIPKNGCSTLRYSLARANNCIAGPEDWIWIHPNNATFAAQLPELITAPFSFAFLRCPHARLASVFLDKIVDKMPQLWLLYRLTRDGFVPDALTFRNFVTLLAYDDRLVCDIHWRPQAHFLVYETYTHLFALEEFAEATQTLQTAIGLDVHDARALTNHGTDAVELIHEGNFADMPLAELAAMKREGTLPGHAQLYDEDLVQQVAALYAVDITLYTGHLDGRHLTFPPSL